MLGLGGSDMLAELIPSIVQRAKAVSNTGLPNIFSILPPAEEGSKATKRTRDRKEDYMKLLNMFEEQPTVNCSYTDVIPKACKLGMPIGALAMVNHHLSSLLLAYRNKIDEVISSHSQHTQLDLRSLHTLSGAFARVCGVVIPMMLSAPTMVLGTETVTFASPVSPAENSLFNNSLEQLLLLLLGMSHDLQDDKLNVWRYDFAHFGHSGPENTMVVQSAQFIALAMLLSPAAHREAIFNTSEVRPSDCDASLLLVRPQLTASVRSLFFDIVSVIVPYVTPPTDKDTSNNAQDASVLQTKTTTIIALRILTLMGNTINSSMVAQASSSAGTGLCRYRPAPTATEVLTADQLSGVQHCVESVSLLLESAHYSVQHEALKCLEAFAFAIVPCGKSPSKTIHYGNIFERLVIDLFFKLKTGTSGIDVGVASCRLINDDIVSLLQTLGAVSPTAFRTITEKRIQDNESPAFAKIREDLLAHVGVLEVLHTKRDRSEPVAQAAAVPIAEQDTSKHRETQKADAYVGSMFEIDD